MADARERVGCSGCAVGVVGVAFSLFWAVALIAGPFAYDRGMRRFLPLALAVLPFLFCWRHPSLSRLMLAVLVAYATCMVVWVLFVAWLQAAF